MKKTVLGLTLHGMLLQACYWLGLCTYYAFMVATLIAYGWTDSAAAGAITAMSVIVMLVQPAYGHLCDKRLPEKKLSVILLVLSAVCFFALPFALRTGSKALILANLVGVTVTAAQVGGVLDAWIVGLKQEFPSISYGLIRGSGSLAYALSAQLMGAVTIAWGHEIRLWFGCGFVLLATFAAMTYRPARRARPQGAESAPTERLGSREAFKLIFSSKPYCLLLWISFFLLLNNIAMSTIIQILVPQLGGTAAQIGTATAIMAASEAPLMFLTAYLLRKVQFKKLLLCCGAAYVIRMVLTASVGTVRGMMAAQLLQGLTYAVLLPVSMSYLSRILDERVRATAITTYAAVTSSLTGILGNLITSAFLAAGFPAQSALIVFSFSALIGFGLALYGSVREIW